MSKKQPEALRLAEMLTADEWPGHVTLVSYARECVAELLRQYAENETLRAGYAAARLEIESLRLREPRQAAQASSVQEDALEAEVLSDRDCRHGRQIGKCEDCALDHMEMAADAEARRVDELTALRKQDEALIRQMLDALELPGTKNHQMLLQCAAAERAARARLEGKP